MTEQVGFPFGLEMVRAIVEANARTYRHPTRSINHRASAGIPHARQTGALEQQRFSRSDFYGNNIQAKKNDDVFSPSSASPNGVFGKVKGEEQRPLTARKQPPPAVRVN